MLPLAIGVGMGLAGQALNYSGAKKDAERKSRAVDQYGRDSAAIYDAMAKDAWGAGMERQRGTGQVIAGLKDTMGTPATAAPQTSEFLPVGPGEDDAFRGDAYRQVMDQATAPRAEVDQANLDADQAGMDRQQLSRLLDALGFSSTIEAQAQAPTHQRLQWQKQRELEEAKRRLEAVLGSTGNSTRNMQLLGSLLNTGSQAAMMYGAMGGGGPTSQVPVTASTRTTP
jgi:hypothetical protein